MGLVASWLWSMSEATFLQSSRDFICSRNVYDSGSDIVAPTYGPVATNFNQSHGLGVTRLETYRGASRDVEAEPVRSYPIELELWIRFYEMVVGTNLQA